MPPAGSSEVPGLEVAGEVAAVGRGVEGWSEGDAVCCLLTGGGFTFFTCVPADLCLPLPRGFSWEMAAAVPVGLAAAWSCLFELGRLVRTSTHRTHAVLLRGAGRAVIGRLHGQERGQSVLIHGGAGGVGHLMIQLAVARGVRVLTTCSSEQRCKALPFIAFCSLNLLVRGPAAAAGGLRKPGA